MQGASQTFRTHVGPALAYTPSFDERKFDKAAAFVWRNWRRNEAFISRGEQPWLNHAHAQSGAQNKT
jgi:hypothetical protein